MEHVRHSHVELVVSQTGGVIAHGIHHPHHGVAMRQCANQTAGGEIARRYHGHMAALALHTVAQARQDRVSVHRAVDVVVEQNHHLARLLCLGDEEHRNKEKGGKESLHRSVL